MEITIQQSILQSNMPETNVIQPQKKKNKRKAKKKVKQPTAADTDTDMQERVLKRPRLCRPRWYNQPYILFLVLRQYPGHSLPRSILVRKAVELDQKYSKELGLGRSFTGKTPQNSASAVLTKNSDKYFVPFYPEGCKYLHFKLAYEPGNVETAITEYQNWQKKLYGHDWPYCFGVPKAKKELDSPGSDEQEDGSLHRNSTPSIESECETPVQIVDHYENIASINEYYTNTKETIINIPVSMEVHNNKLKDANIHDQLEGTIELNALSTLFSLPSTASSSTDTSENTSSENSTNNMATNPPPEPFISLDDLDLSDIPKSWKDIVYVSTSKIPGAGNGLFAKRKIPYNTPIGFYFGVPMTEDEYDSLKDRVGRASQYSIMYRKTVLDATDDKGEPIDDQDSPRYCPFHFMNETDEEASSVLFVEGVAVNQVICWTKRDIEEGEELLGYYGQEVNRHWSPDKDKKKDIVYSKVMKKDRPVPTAIAMSTESETKHDDPTVPKDNSSEE
ncbi:hypothetical protein BDB01DRAFT_781560 [Pilobolus umbonatus]|nr:hypothetical protein BDB01DRAFT_781560 [Pilobolus umbonatus]